MRPPVHQQLKSLHIIHPAINTRPHIKSGEVVYFPFGACGRAESCGTVIQARRSRV
jgi:hypothetical protein